MVCAVGVNTTEYAYNQLEEKQQKQVEFNDKRTKIEENIDRFYERFAKIKKYATLVVLVALTLLWIMILSFSET